MKEVKVWAVGTGYVNPFVKKSRMAAKFISTLDGFIGVHPMDGRTAWLFKTENQAKRARNKMVAEGIQCGKGVSDCWIDEKYCKEKN